MVNITETDNFDEGVYQYQTTDPALGGPTGVMNTPLGNLANRTKYLFNRIAELLAGSSLYAKDSSAVANTITLAFSPSITNLVDGILLRFKAANSNTAATTVNVNGLGAVPLVSPIGALQGGEVVAGAIYEIIYNATTSNFVLIASGAGSFGAGTGRLVGFQDFTSSGTYTPNPLAKSVIVEAVGGGGSGGGAGYIFTAGYCTVGGPGGAGGYVKHRITSLDSSYAVTIGAGGAAVSGDFAGAAGGSTLVGSIIVAHGGWGGATSGNGNSGGVPYFVTQPSAVDNTGGNIVSKKGEKGQYGLRISSSTSGFVAVSGTGGQGPFGNGGAGRSTVLSSDDANGYGAGGGGALNWSASTTSTSVASGKGSGGRAIFWELA